MSLHVEKMNVARLDALAREVLAEAIRFERAKSNASFYGDTVNAAEGLCSKVAAYREAMVQESLGLVDGGAV